MLYRAMDIAKQAHWGQKDKGGNPYIEHPMAVMRMVGGGDDAVVALLHDVVEDSNVDVAFLRAEGFSESVLFAVECITRNKGESYDDYLQRLILSDVAIRVKIADMKHNSDLNRIKNPTQKDINRAKKYEEKIAYLESLKDL